MIRTSVPGRPLVAGLLLLLFLGPMAAAAQTSVTEPQEALLEELESDYEAEATTPDPLQPFNRLMFSLNDKLYFYALKPLGQGYAAVLPENFRQSLGNAFDNLRAPGRSLNSLLQGDPLGAAKEVACFVINTCLGFAGLLTPSQGLEALDPAPQPTDTGLTLGTWGLGHGVYLVWPFLGPSSLRDSLGRVGDAFLDPLTYVEPDPASMGLKAGERVNAVSLRLGDYEELIKSTLDPYTAVKDAYLQHRDQALER
jgi:phospholipid-binding lipoprotein MlaA